MLELIKIYYIVLFAPEEISNHINGLQKKLFILHRIIVSFFFSGSLLLLKKKIGYIDLLLLVVLLLIFYMIVSLSSLIISSLYYNKIFELSDRYSDEPTSKIKTFIEEARYILDLGWLPIIFLIHFSILSKYFNSFIIFFLGFILLIIWKFYILWKGIQFHFEWDKKISLLSLINHVIYLFSLPFLYFILLILVIFTIIK